MKILLLVIASHNKLYDQYLEYWSHIIKKKPDYVDIYLMLNDEDMETDHKIDEDNSTIYFKHQENFIPGIMIKTDKALRIFQDYNYDYVIRTNLSTYFDFDKLHLFLENTANVNRAYGPFVRFSRKFGKQKFIVGFCIIMSRKIVNQVLKYIDDNKESNEKFNKVYYKWADDVVFGYIFQQLKIHMIKIQQFLLTANQLNKVKTVDGKNKFIFRNRCYEPLEKRFKVEPPRYKMLLEHFKVI